MVNSELNYLQIQGLFIDMNDGCERIHEHDGTTTIGFRQRSSRAIVQTWYIYPTDVSSPKLAPMTSEKNRITSTHQLDDIMAMLATKTER